MLQKGFFVPDKQEEQLVLFPSADLENLRYKARRIWSKSFWPLVLFLLGYYIGEAMTEKRVLDDCRFSTAFRVGYIAYSCQRRNI